MNTTPNAAPGREHTSVTCSACGAETTVPFTPTPGRPVYCRACFAKRNTGPAGGPGGARRGGFRASDTRRPTARKRMLAMGRKQHFQYDVHQVLSRGTMIEENRRVLIEMVFQRGSRQGTDAALDFLREKVDDETITEQEGENIADLIDRYSFRR